jgi:poly-gamma-glutamate synthesis protein (capsule biosynthesis protein)
VNPPGFAARPAAAGTARADPVAIAADVRGARRQADLVVVWFHWGVELHASPDARQLGLATAALAAGATVVLGAHPHVLGPVDRPRRHTLVAWTLGNFVFPSGPGATARTAILDVRLTKQGVAGYDLVPARSGIQPALAS